MELRTGQGTMSSSLPALFCLGLCLEQVIHAHYGPLPKPSLQALPSSLVPLGTPVTVRCQGPPGVDLYRLEKLKSSQYFDYGVLSFSAMEKRFAGVYRCSYQNGSRWSLPSSQLELVATGVFTKPSLSAQPSAAVSPGMDVTLRCESQYGFDRFALYKEGDTGPYKRPEQWYLADFPITTVTAANSGTYRCYSFSSSSPYLWSAPSDPLELVVKGNSVTPSWLPTELPSSVTESSEAPGRLSPSLVNQGSTAGISPYFQRRQTLQLVSTCPSLDQLPPRSLTLPKAGCFPYTQELQPWALGLWCVACEGEGVYQHLELRAGQRSGVKVEVF
ncbi:platelet glycoprotein VI isoform X3 [Camelus dromedarius]|uniref:platelet glycoprotein VI isoform X3 n=1 Tax=Camelus dromedarius TaxID=9838 RepID=UPI003119C8AB